MMSVYVMPSRRIITEKYLIDLIREAFELKLNIWVTCRSRVDEYCIPRQVLMACLLDFCDYTMRGAGAVCYRSQPDAFNAHKKVHETLMNDKEYGWRIQLVYNHLRTLPEVQKTEHKKGFTIKE